MSAAPRSETKKIGTRPFSGSRFVEGGKVRIEWFPGGGRRAMTIGPDSKANRKYADKVLVDALALARTSSAARAPNTRASSRELEASRLAPCRPVAAHSPTAHRPASELRPCASTATPPIW